MVIIPILLWFAAPVTSDDLIRQQAVRCGLKPDQLVWTTDAAGHRHADITPNGNFDGFFPTFKCIMDWASRSGIRIGFISEPPPAAGVPQSPLAAGPLNSVLEAVAAADICGIRQLRLDTRREEGLALARLYLDGADPSDGEMSCIQTWLTRNGKRLGLMPRWWKDDFTKDKRNVRFPPIADITVGLVPHSEPSPKCHDDANGVGYKEAQCVDRAVDEDRPADFGIDAVLHEVIVTIARCPIDRVPA